MIADLTATRFRDSVGLRHLVLAYRQAADADTDLRLAVHPAGPVSRIVELTASTTMYLFTPRSSSPSTAPRHLADPDGAGCLVCAAGQGRYPPRESSSAHSTSQSCSQV